MSQQDSRGPRPPQQQQPQVSRTDSGASGKGQAPTYGKPAQRSDVAARGPADKDRTAAAAGAVPNGTAAPPAVETPKSLSWASIASGTSSPQPQPAPQQPVQQKTASAAPSVPKTQAAPPSAPPKPAPGPSTGVTLPKGVAGLSERQPSIKFGNIDPSEIVPQADKVTAPAAAPMPVQQVSTQPPAASPPPAAAVKSPPRPAAAGPQQAAPSAPSAVVIPPSAAAAGAPRPLNFAAATAKGPPPPPPAAAAPSAVPSVAAAPFTAARHSQQGQQHGSHHGGAARERGQHGSGPRGGQVGQGAMSKGHPAAAMQQAQQYGHIQYGQYLANPTMAGYAGYTYVPGAAGAYGMTYPSYHYGQQYGQPYGAQPGGVPAASQGGRSGMPAPPYMQGAAGVPATPPKGITPPQKKILKLEDPNTHQKFSAEELAKGTPSKPAAAAKTAPASPQAAPAATPTTKAAGSPAAPVVAQPLALEPKAAEPPETTAAAASTKPLFAEKAAASAAPAAAPSKSAEPVKPALSALTTGPAAVPSQQPDGPKPVAPAGKSFAAMAAAAPSVAEVHPVAPAALAKPAQAAPAAASKQAEPAADIARAPAAAGGAASAKIPSAAAQPAAAPAAKAAAATAPAAAGVWGMPGPSFKEKLLVPAEEAKKKVEEEARAKAEEERKKREAEEARRRQQQEEEEAARRKAVEAEAARKAAAEAEEAARKAAAEVEARLKAEEAEKKKREEEEQQRLKREAEEKKKAEEALQKAEANAAAAKQAKEAQEAALAAEAKRRADEQAAAASAAATAAAAEAEAEAEAEKAAAAEKAEAASASQQAATTASGPTAAVGFSAAEVQERPPSPDDSDAAVPADISPFRSLHVKDEEEEEEEEGEEPSTTGYDDSSGRKRYTRLFLLKTAEECWRLPPGVEDETLRMLGTVPQEEARARGAMYAAATRGPPDRMDSQERWPSGRIPSGGPPMGRGPPPDGRMGRQQSGRPRGGIDGDQWARGQALPPMPGMPYGGRGMGPPPGMRGPPGGGYFPSSGPLPALHRTESAYKVGRTLTDDPDEEKAQKALKAQLNKITPDNFDRIHAQIVDKINERKKAKTLVGFIDQIFDKALIETTFAQLYAKLVAQLKPSLPDLQEEDGEVINFRRTLLNKCQEEFEHGQAAMMAVKEREARRKEAGDAADEEEAKEDEEAKDEDAEDVEEGEITAEAKAAKDAKEAARAAKEAKKAEARKAEEDRKARNRMLGNIIFVGQLYLSGSLTEGVIHTCIRQLLDETDNPRPEDVECLCKLMTTVGGPLDKSARIVDKGTGATSAAMMDVYFKRIQDLMANPALDSRHKFMLQDLLDLRQSRWSARRKAEGPKTIEEIHRQAQNERNRTAMLDRQQPGREFPRGAGPPQQRRGPMFDRTDAPVRAMARVSSNEAMQSFRPGGRPGPAAAGSFRERAGPPVPMRAPSPPVLPSSAAEQQQQQQRRRESPESSERQQQQPHSEAAKQQQEQGGKLSDDEALDQIKALLLELYNSHDVKGGVLCLKEVSDRGADMAAAFNGVLRTSLEAKGTNWDLCEQLLMQSAGEGLLSSQHIEAGALQLLNELDDITVDVPKAPQQIGEVLGALVAGGHADLNTVGEHIRSADMEEVPEGEDTMLVGSGNAAKVIATLLQKLRSVKGEEDMAASWKATGLDLKLFLPQPDRENAQALQQLVSKYGLEKLVI